MRISDWSSYVCSSDLIPARAQWQLSDDAAYVHITSNETIHGVEYADTPEAGHAPLIADMSSSILSRRIDVSRYGMIYAGAQKNKIGRASCRERVCQYV